MSQKSGGKLGHGESFTEWLERIAGLKSGRRVRRIVTRSGTGARGNFPSRKSPKRLQFESLVEERVLRVLEVSSLPRVIQTQPCVLDLPGDPEPVRYTPDAQAEIAGAVHFFESKHDRFAQKEEERERVRTVAHRMRAQGLKFTLIVDSDVRIGGLQEEIAELLRERPLVGRYRDDIDPNAWDPFGRHEPDPEMEQRWLCAQGICDDLLTRVMRRDPDDLIAELVA